MYQFKDEYNTVTIYKHHDGYPEGACKALQKALDYAWQLPRFEADEFAAAFCAGNKPGWKEVQAESMLLGSLYSLCGGGVRVVASGDEDAWQRTLDIDYRYLVYMKGSALWVECWDVMWKDDADPNGIWEQKSVFEGSFEEFVKAVAKAREANLPLESISSLRDKYAK